MPLEVAMELIKQEQEQELNRWRRARFNAVVTARSMGADVDGKDFFELPEDSKTRIDIDTLKKLSRHGKI